MDAQTSGRRTADSNGEGSCQMIPWLLGLAAILMTVVGLMGVLRALGQDEARTGKGGALGKQDSLERSGNEVTQRPGRRRDCPECGGTGKVHYTTETRVPLNPRGNPLERWVYTRKVPAKLVHRCGRCRGQGWIMGS